MKIVEVKDYKKLGKIFNDAGLEVKTFDELPKYVIHAYEAYEGDKLVGGVSIEHKKGEYVVFDIAVIEELRGTHIGETMLLHALDKIKSYGADRVYLVAKAPKFFAKYGFDYVPDDEVPPLFNCLTCESYNVTCFPKVMKLQCK